MRSIWLSLALALSIACVVFVPTRGAAAGSQDQREIWHQFRGPGGNGVAQGTDLPAVWSRTQNVDWVVDVPGRGWSSPIVWDGQVFLTAATGDESAEYRGLGGAIALPEELRTREDFSEPLRWMVYALDAETGRVMWEREAHRGIPSQGRHVKNTYASETPATDGERLYVYFANIALMAYSLGGELLWKQPIKPKLVAFGDWELGAGASPVVHDGRVYVLSDNEQSSFLSAFDASTGRELWRTERRLEHPETQSGWATPYVWEVSGRTEIVAVGPGAIISYGIDGDEIWRLEGWSRDVVSTPVSAGDVLYVASGSPAEDERPIVAIRRGATGKLSRDGGESAELIRWQTRRGGSYVPSPVVYGENLFVLDDKGILSAYDAVSGERRYRARVGEGLSGFTSSPWAYDGKILCLNEDGDTFVIRAGNTFELLAKNRLDEYTLASPAVADGRLYIRTATKLYRIGSSP